MLIAQTVGQTPAIVFIFWIGVLIWFFAGRRKSETRECSECGWQGKKEARFCPMCGDALFRQGKSEG